MRNTSWTETEQMKVVWNIIDSELLKTTEPRTQARKEIVDGIVTKLLADPDFSERHNAKDPTRTVYQHIQLWISYFEVRGKAEKPALVR